MSDQREACAIDNTLSDGKRTIVSTNEMQR